MAYFSLGASADQRVTKAALAGKMRSAPAAPVSAHRVYSHLEQPSNVQPVAHERACSLVGAHLVRDRSAGVYRSV